MPDFQILGPLAVVGADGPIRLGGPKQRATLAILLLNANHVVSVERLADELYAGAPPVTAVTQVQRQISELRKLLGPPAIETRPPGYLLHVPGDELDLDRFERLTHEGTRALARGDAKGASALLRDALALWRGAPLADFTYEPFARVAIERFEEIRRAALEKRIDAELALGHHAELVGELEALAVEHPLTERFRGQLMLALYRSGRQREALEVYRQTREALADELGIEPTPALRQLQRAILEQAPWLDQPAVPAPPSARAVLVAVQDEQTLDGLLSVAEPLASLAERELIVASLLDEPQDLVGVAARLNARRTTLEVSARVAAFTTTDVAGDVLRLAVAHEVDLVLLGGDSGLGGQHLPDELARIFERAPADVAVLTRSDKLGDGRVFVPFAGGEHDWAALEVAAWLSLATSKPLTLVGTKADARHHRRDASRLLADASLAIQRVVGVEVEPLLAEPSEEGLLRAVAAAAVVVAGVSERWRREGIGESRRGLLRRAQAPVLLVHRGRRPGGLAPREASTRFSWTIESRYLQAVSIAAM